jgi:hypothetical protein
MEAIPQTGMVHSFRSDSLRCDRARSAEYLTKMMMKLWPDNSRAPCLCPLDLALPLLSVQETPSLLLLLVPLRTWKHCAFSLLRH